jgi:dsDNA-specific endonuclease/ATPase MutS2
MKTIDLHGLTLEEARRKVIKGLEGAYRHHEQVVRIIHGQGKHSEFFPVLKSFVRHYLEESEFGRQKVAAFFRGENGSPYTLPNAGETIVVLKTVGKDGVLYDQPLISFEEEEEREARKNSKAMRADRLRTARRRGPRFR